ncbi:hypothetical protein HZS_1084, partial [Henneguya salminicola]
MRAFDLFFSYPETPHLLLNYMQGPYLKSKDQFLEAVDLSSHSMNSAAFLIFYDGQERIELTFQLLYIILSQISILIQTVLEKCNSTIQNLVLISCLPQDLIGTLFSIFCFITGVVFVPVDFQDSQLFSQHINSLKNIFRRVLIVTVPTSNIKEKLNKIHFIEINSHFTENIEILFKNVELNFILCELMSPEYPIYFFVKDRFPIAYVSYSSGTTGPPKSVLVTYKSFMACLHSSICAFYLNKDSVLFVSSPFTFDPCILQIVLALAVKCQLLLVSKSIKINPNNLVEIFIESRLTHLQCIPSLLYNIGPSLMNHYLFNPQSSIQYIILGGETFPSSYWLKQCLSVQNDKRKLPIFVNLYGTTEISPWSSYYIVSPPILNSYLEGHIHIPIIGTLFPDTTFRIEQHDSDIGVLYLENTHRICIVGGDISKLKLYPTDRSEDMSYLSTGDLVKRTNEGVVYYSRLNNCIKRSGKMINLDLVKDQILDNAHDLIFQCIIIPIFESEQPKLYLYYSTQSKKEIFKSNLIHRLSMILSPSCMPNKIIHVPQMPLNSNGKVDIQRLSNTHAQMEIQTFDNISLFHTVNMHLREALAFDKNIILKEVNDNSNFIECGGDSLMAVYFIDCIKPLFNNKDPNLFDENLLLRILFDQKIRDVHKVIKKMYFNPGNLSVESPPTNIFTFNFQWEVDAKKCIDACPISYCKDNNVRIFIGSHSGIFFCINIQNGSIEWQKNLNTRILAPAVITKSGHYVVVGAYDTNVYSFEIDTGNIYWIFQTEGIVKTAIIALHNDIVASNSYDGHMYLLNVKKKTVIWKYNIDHKILPSIPTYCRLQKRLYCASGGGTVVSITDEGILQWSRKLDSPIFSSLIHHNQSLIVAEVQGIVYLLDDTTGYIQNQISTSETIYANILLLPEQNRFYIATQEGNIFCINTRTFYQLIKICLGASIYACPVIYYAISRKQYLMIMTTNGVIHVYDEINHDLCGNFDTLCQSLSPLFCHDNFLIISSTNNKLSCFKIDP